MRSSQIGGLLVNITGPTKESINSNPRSQCGPTELKREPLARCKLTDHVSASVSCPSALAAVTVSGGMSGGVFNP